ncbi:predicted protein [Chaetoceros tenuissimus]|uniref:AP2/ERF domain-containing protein n=1 Tax=Chaetoceros tenuissimus TaxID=426638 RepID=A0AAD3H6E7_9STRA|nr:predicted protein [Chaetoceros tenuissimus]
MIRSKPNVSNTGANDAPTKGRAVSTTQSKEDLEKEILNLKTELEGLAHKVKKYKTLFHRDAEKYTRELQEADKRSALLQESIEFLQLEKIDPLQQENDNLRKDLIQAESVRETYAAVLDELRAKRIEAEAKPSHELAALKVKMAKYFQRDSEKRIADAKYDLEQQYENKLQIKSEEIKQSLQQQYLKSHRQEMEKSVTPLEMENTFESMSECTDYFEESDSAVTSEDARYHDQQQPVDPIHETDEGERSFTFDSMSECTDHLGEFDSSFSSEDARYHDQQQLVDPIHETDVVQNIFGDSDDLNDASEEDNNMEELESPSTNLQFKEHESTFHVPNEISVSNEQSNQESITTEKVEFSEILLKTRQKNEELARENRNLRLELKKHHDSSYKETRVEELRRKLDDINYYLKNCQNTELQGFTYESLVKEEVCGVELPVKAVELFKSTEIGRELLKSEIFARALEQQMKSQDNYIPEPLYGKLAKIMLDLHGNHTAGGRMFTHDTIEKLLEALFEIFGATAPQGYGCTDESTQQQYYKVLDMMESCVEDAQHLGLDKKSGYPPELHDAKLEYDYSRMLWEKHQAYSQYAWENFIPVCIKILRKRGYRFVGVIDYSTPKGQSLVGNRGNTKSLLQNALQGDEFFFVETRTHLCHNRKASGNVAHHIFLSFMDVSIAIYCHISGIDESKVRQNFDYCDSTSSYYEPITKIMSALGVEHEMTPEKRQIISNRIKQTKSMSANISGMKASITREMSEQEIQLEDWQVCESDGCKRKKCLDGLCQPCYNTKYGKFKCGTKGCENGIHNKGLCNTCHRKKFEMDENGNWLPAFKCGTKGCESRKHIKGLCQTCSKKASTKMKGFTAYGRKWKASVTFARKTCYIGTFDSKEMAALAFRIANEYLKTINKEYLKNKGSFTSNDIDEHISAAKKAAIAGVNQQYPQAASTKMTGITAYGEKWKARIGFARKTYYIGIFDSKEMAALAFRIAKENLKPIKKEYLKNKSSFTSNDIDEHISAAKKAAIAGIHLVDIAESGQVEEYDFENKYSFLKKASYCFEQANHESFIRKIGAQLESLELRSQLSNGSVRIDFEDYGSGLLQKVLEENLYNEAKLLIKEMQPFVLKLYPASTDFLDRNVLSHIKN